MKIIKGKTVVIENDAIAMKRAKKELDSSALSITMCTLFLSASRDEKHVLPEIYSALCIIGKNRKWIRQQNCRSCHILQLCPERWTHAEIDIFSDVNTCTLGYRLHADAHILLGGTCGTLASSQYSIIVCMCLYFGCTRSRILPSYDSTEKRFFHDINCVPCFRRTDASKR